MGEVWSATDLNLDRLVAVKLVLADMPDEGAAVALARFHREGKAAARLNHPHIAVIYDAGTHDAHPYLVMELLQGPDLQKVLRDTPAGLPIEVALEYGAQAAEALAGAHGAGVVHRDVKPANLLLDQVGRVKVCDFGIAALQGATTRLTASGTPVGTFAYMAPEQLTGQPVTGAIDVYALGATLFHLITGHLLFPDADLRTVIAKILMEPPPALSTLRPGIPPRLDAYLMSMLAKDPGDRPAIDSVPAALRSIASVPQAWADALLTEAEDLARTISEVMTDTLFARIATVRAIWDVDGAERIAKSIEDPPGRSWVLLEVAQGVAATDKVRAAGLLAAAEHAARNMIGGDRPLSGDYARTLRLRDIAKAVAMRDPAEAERIARSITDDNDRSVALKEVAEVAAERDPDAAQRIAFGLGDDLHWQTQALCAVAEVLAKRDPGRSMTLVSDAEKIVHRMPANSDIRARGLTAVAQGLTDSDPQRARRLLAEAERVARSLDPSWKDFNLRQIAETLAALDPTQAQRIARDVTDDFGGQVTLRKVARVTAAHDPAQARSIAVSIGGDPQHQAYHRASALIGIAQVVIGDDPERAAALLAEAEQQARTIGHDNSREDMLTKVGQTLAQIDPAGALLIAETLDSLWHRAQLLASAARGTAERDPARAAGILADAERNARLIEYPYGKAWTLTAIVAIQLGPYPQSLMTMGE